MLPSPEFRLQYDPVLIPELATEYMRSGAEQDREAEAAGARILAGERTRQNLEIICRWKSKRRFKLLGLNSDDEIASALHQAIQVDSIGEATSALTELHGVGVKMASAILTAVRPEQYTVLDFRALHALGVADGSSIGLYIAYVEACRKMAAAHGRSLPR